MLPVEVAEPITTADAPVVLQLKQAPIMAIQPTGEEVQLAAGGHTAACVADAPAPAHGAGAPGHSQHAAADRSVRAAGAGRELSPSAALQNVCSSECRYVSARAVEERNRVAALARDPATRSSGNATKSDPDTGADYQAASHR
jgi:hypothetical protein